MCYLFWHRNNQTFDLIHRQSGRKDRLSGKQTQCEEIRPARTSLRCSVRKQGALPPKYEMETEILYEYESHS